MGFINKDQLAGIMSAVKEYVSSVANVTQSSLHQYVDEHNYIKTTYSDLKKKRDNKELIPGAQYRITDYQTTTVQPYTESRGIRFDVIVTAIDEKTLSEDAKAINHEYGEEGGFTPFDSSLFEIKYCLDNDVDRFAWADNIDYNIYHFRFAGDAVPIKDTNFEYSQLISLSISQIAGFDCYTFSPEGAPGYVYGIVVDDVVSVAELTDDTEIRGFVQMPNSWEETEGGESIEVEGKILEQTFEYKDNFNTSKVCNGKGVIYYMKDENGCEAPYDFKNILFDGQGTFGNHRGSIASTYDEYGTQILNNIVFNFSDESAIITVEPNCKNLRLRNISGNITIHAGVQGTSENPILFQAFSENTHIYTNEGEIAETSPNIIIRRLDEIQRMYEELKAMIQGGATTPPYAVLDNAILDQVILS